MKVTVKAAHYFVHGYFSRCGILNGLVPHLYEVKPEVARSALKLLGNPNDRYDSCIFDPLHPICNADERHLLRACVNAGYRERTIRPSLTFTVPPTMTIGALKSLLKPLSWIPENFLLVQNEERALEDNNSTLSECGFKDQNLLLTCIGGGFPLLVKNITHGGEFLIPISGCFETVGDLKEKIFRKIGHLPEDQSLTYQNRRVCNRKETRLVSLGIVRDVPEDLRRIKLCYHVRRFTPEKVEELELRCPI